MQCIMGLGASWEVLIGKDTSGWWPVRDNDDDDDDGTGFGLIIILKHRCQYWIVRSKHPKMGLIYNRGDGDDYMMSGICLAWWVGQARVDGWMDDEDG